MRLVHTLSQKTTGPWNEPKDPIQFTEANEGNEEPFDVSNLFVPFVIFCSNSELRAFNGDPSVEID